MTGSLLTSALLIGGLALAAPAGAQEPPREPAPSIQVSGEGRASVAPDMAIVTLAVTRMGDTAEAALAANSAAMRDVLAALKEAGLADRDMQTSDFSIYPRYSQPDPNRPNGSEAQEPKIIGYQVSNGLTLRVRDLAKLGALLDRSVKLGINQGGQINFTNDDPKAALEEARREAVKDAMQRAKTLSDAAGVKLGAVLSISENSLRPEPVPMMRSMALAKEADSVPLAAGENSYRVTVDMRFGLVQNP
ncbi:SIMPL domain-containing protein [Rhizobium sp. SSA_523]|uniref:SIMPL domain-containing protein n=1 Tax=Rhizobium sp. SSA_523 TaxID=2952477 RepID=UPI0020918CAC|nr:SIMPL domain-containing protein [Rhizobium sp. SSA_523]MCO5730356.1 SIMPL domain-containing protein [Rhizobium sp. SSA_523]WKC25676.1 SIMPL domain-containing protein [Rhizobium sp. SSA_523]